MQAATQVNTMKASKRVMQTPTWLRFREGCQGKGKPSGSLCLSAGVGVAACMRRGCGATREVRAGGENQRATREGQARPIRMADRPVIAEKLGNSSGAKGP